MSEIDYTYYGYRFCVGAYFEMPTADARRLLPKHLEPMEVMHTRSVLAITAFEFTESMVGPYNEVVLAVVVPPKVEPGRPLPKAGFYPFMVATTTEASREHAIERWHLPHYMKDVDIEFTQDAGSMTVNVRDEGEPVLDLVVTQFTPELKKNLYACFTTEDSDRFKVNIFMEAEHSEHEEERGELTLYPHPMTEGLTIEEVHTWPFREEWYGEGVQTFEELESF